MGAVETARAAVGDALLGDAVEHGMQTLTARPEAAFDLLRALRDDPALGYIMLLDVTAVDGLDLGWSPRFQVAWHLYSFLRNDRVRVVAPVPESDPRVPSVFTLWKSADWLERETWDQYGIVFEGHPNLERLLNHKDFVGHPLRRDYDIKKGQWLSEPDDLLDQLEKARAGLLPDN